jgi:hypothetical protein
MTITAAYLTPSFLSTFLPTLWSPLVHYLPSLVLAVTLAAVKDDVAFLTGVIGRVNGLSKSSALSSAESTAPQILLAYLQTSQRSVEYTDIVGQAVREANASAAEKATQALHEKAQKARAELSSTESSGRKRKLNESSASSAASAGPPGKAAATGKDRQGKMVMSRDTTFAAPVSASSSSRPLHSSARSGTPSTSPQLSSTRAPGQAPTAVSGSPQQHRGFASPSLGSVNRNEAGMMTPSRRGLFGPGFSGSNYAQHSSSVSASLCRSSANMFQYGSIDYLRSKLLFHLDRCRFTLSKQIDSLRLHLGAWMDAARVVRLEVMMMLYAGYQPRSPEMEVIINFLPSSHQLQEKHLTALDAIGVHAFMELLQMLVTFACVCPYVCMPSASPIHSSRSTPPPSSTAQYLPLFLSLRSHYFPLAVKAQRSVITERGDSEKAERYLLQQPGAHAGSREPILVENLLQQVGVSGVIGRPTDLTHLLRSLLKLPGHFKPALLNPYVDRVTPHMKEIQSMVSTQVYTKMELVEECFLRAWETSERKQQHGARKLIHQSEGEAIFTLSPSAYSSLSFHHSLTSCAYLLRNSSNGSSSSSGLSSHLTRPFFQSHAGWWMARVMKTVVRRSDNDGISSPLDHPFSCHPLSFTLLDSLLTFSLSACIQDHLHLQPLGAQQHRCETTERDGRAWEERGMKEFISELCPPADAPFTPIDRLANPCGLAWMLYYVLHHNAMAMAMWTKASSSNASAAYLPPAPDAEMSTVPLPPPSSKEAMSGNYSATYTALGLPPPPFSASVAQAVSVGSAVLPYGSHVLDNVPMRGVLEWVKQQVQRYANDKSHTVLHSNFTALFLHLLRLLSRLHPDSLVGFSIPSSLLGVGVDAAKIDAIGWVEKEGSLGVMRFGEQEEEVKQETAVKSEDTKMSDAQSSPRRLPSKSLLSSESAEVESFLRALANPEQICLSASEAEARWCSLYSRSTISGSQFVHRTLLAALLAKRNDSSSPPSWNDLLMNPCLLIDASTFTPLSQLSVTPHLLRIFLTCVFHVIVASTSFFSTYSRTEAFSLQLVRQSLYHSTYSSWLSALQLLLPSPDACSPLSSSSFSRFTSQQQKIYQDPLALWSQKEVEKATRELWQSERRQQERSKTGSSATAALATSALAAAETEERTAKKARRASTNDLAATIKQESTEVKAKEESTDATVKDEPMQIDAEQKNDSAAAVPTSEDVKVEPIVAAAAPSSSAATSSAAPRPFSFLVSDRLLSAADQVTFSNEFALGAESPASTENAAAGAQTTMSPALRAFIYLLTTRASIAHAVLDAAAALHVKAPQHLVPAEAASLGVLFAFLRLLFTSSTSADSSSPSSLFLLLHIQGYSPSLLPRMKREFPVLIGQLLEEGVVKERVQRGVGGSEVERQQHAKFVQQLCEKEEKTPAVAASGVKMEL